MEEGREGGWGLLWLGDVRCDVLLVEPEDCREVIGEWYGGDSSSQGGDDSDLIWQVDSEFARLVGVFYFREPFLCCLFD